MRAVHAVAAQVGDFNTDAEDAACVTLECGDAARPLAVSIHLDYFQRPPVKRCVIVGTAGVIRCDLLAYRAELDEGGTPSAIDDHGRTFERNRLYIDLLKAFLDAVAGATSPIVPLADAIATTRVIAAARGHVHTPELHAH